MDAGMAGGWRIAIVEDRTRDRRLRILILSKMVIPSICICFQMGYFLICCCYWSYFFLLHDCSLRVSTETPGSGKNISRIVSSFY